MSFAGGQTKALANSLKTAPVTEYFLKHDKSLIDSDFTDRLDVEVEGCFPSFPLLFSLQVQALPGRMLPLL